MEKAKISLLKENPKNPRQIKTNRFNKLVKSIQEFPEMLKTRPIVVDDNMVVLGGNMRLKACIRAGIKEVYIQKVSEWTDEQKEQFVIKDNVSYGEWDVDSLANCFERDALLEMGLLLFVA